MKFKLRTVIVLSAAILSLSAAARADEGENLVLDPIALKTKLLGHPLKIEERGETLPSNQGVRNSIHSQFLGNDTALVEASVEAIPSAAPSATPAQGIELARTDLYIGGTKIWAGSLRFRNGGLAYSGGVAPTQLPFPLLVYPLGPLLLELDAGVEFEGDLVASLTPGLSYPLPDSTLNASVEAKLYVAGYVEGYGSIWFVRGGVGGRLNLINGSTGISANLFMNGQKPVGKYLGRVVLLNGSVYGFVDTNLLFGKWTRIIKKDFFKWSGRCYSFDNSQCGLN